jgi:hypothetical protein
MRRRSVRVWRPVWVWGVGRGLVEGDAQADLDVPAGDADFLDEEPQELLFPDRIELVDYAADSFGEVVDSAVELIAADQGRALVGEAGSFRLELTVAGGDVRGPPLQIRPLDQSGLVEVDQPTLFSVGGFEFVVQLASSAASS